MLLLNHNSCTGFLENQEAEMKKKVATSAASTLASLILLRRFKKATQFHSLLAQLRPTKESKHSHLTQTIQHPLGWIAINNESDKQRTTHHWRNRFPVEGIGCGQGWTISLVSILPLSQECWTYEWSLSNTRGQGVVGWQKGSARRTRNGHYLLLQYRWLHYNLFSVGLSQDFGYGGQTLSAYFNLLSRMHNIDIFKVETIWDSWMGVTNLIKDQQQHTKTIVDFASDALAASAETLMDVDDTAKGTI